MKKILLTSAIAAAMILASCSKDGGENAPPAEDFQVKLSFANAPTSRATGAKADGGTKIAIEDGYLCFVNGSGAITDVYTISNAASDIATGGKNISNGDLASVSLPKVPGSSVKVYLIANKKTISPAPAVAGSMAAYLDKQMAVADQSVYTTVTCVDDADLTGSGDSRSASIVLATNVSRIQITDLKFENMTGSVAGIFINGFYSAMELDGGVVGTLSASSTASHYVVDASGSPFTSALGGYVYDAFTESIAATVTPDGGAVWGYNLFTSPTPQIIIKLTGVEANGNTLGTRFITINGFNNGTTPVTTLAGGMIYTIGAGALTISPEHLAPEPGVTPFAVNVTIQQAEWDETTVTPNL
ncbi:MAG: hypothetical protein LBU80_03030 [Rikenellaceae bacterium]|jgi:hypothetical protein|nr:hypothetical protein [Rikenellaceae bacterium]